MGILTIKGQAVPYASGQPYLRVQVGRFSASVVPLHVHDLESRARASEGSDSSFEEGLAHELRYLQQTLEGRAIVTGEFRECDRVRADQVLGLGNTVDLYKRILGALHYDIPQASR